jgi:hypothetical protein
MTRKIFLRWLRKEASKLPNEYYTVTHRLFNVMPVEVGEGEDFDFEKTDGEGKSIKFKLVNGIEEPHKVNHYRRLKRGFKEKGFAFIESYFNQRGFKQQNTLKNGESYENGESVSEI